MNDAINTFPVGMQILGRVLNTNGEPIDKKGPITNVQRLPILKPAFELMLNLRLTREKFH